MTEPLIKLPEPKGVAEAIVLSSQLQSHYDLGSDLSPDFDSDLSPDFDSDLDHDLA
jgi:hypothetical protein